MLKVLHVIKSLDIGGIETLALDVCGNAHRHGIETHLVCIGGGALEDAFRRTPAKFRLMRKMPRPKDMIDPILIFRLRRYIITNNIQIVHCHFADEGMHAYLALRGLKNVTLIQGVAVNLKINLKTHNRKFRFLSSRVKATVAPGKTTVEQLTQMGMNKKNNARYVHNGIDPKRVTPNTETTSQAHCPQLRKKLNIPQDAVVAGMLGNFYNQVRDQYTVCRALPEVIRKNPQFHFVFGGGYKNKWIKTNEKHYNQCLTFCRDNNITSNVHFPGLISHNPQFFQALDFYVHSTNYDTFGIAPVEAMFNKLPVMANNAPIFRETSYNGKGMWLFEDKQPKDLAAKMVQLIENQNLRREMGEKHYQHAQKYFHIDTHIQNMKELYLELHHK